MSQRYSIDGQILTDMADAIRNSTGIKPSTVVAPGYLNPGEKSSGQIMPDLKAGQRYKITITCSYTTDGTYKRALLTIKENSSSGAVLFSDYVYQRAVEAYITPSVDTTYFMFGLGANNYCTIDSITIEPCDADGNVLCYYTPEQMVEEMKNDLIPASALNIQGRQYAFAYNTWNWFIEQCGDRINFRTPDNGKNLFFGCHKLINIPFDIHIDCIASNRLEVLDNCFTGCAQLEKYPNIYFHNTKDKTKVLLGKFMADTTNASIADQFIFFDGDVSIMGFNYGFLDSYKYSYIPNWLFDGTLNIDWDTMRAENSTFGTVLPVNLINAKYLRTMPFFKEFYTTHNNSSEYYHPWYQFSIQNCFSLEEIVLPRPGSLALTSNKFSSNEFHNLNRMKSLKFDVQEDGTPYTAQWKNQTLDLTYCLGYAYTDSVLTNVGFSEENKITNEEQWRAYVDGTNPDAWSSLLEYATYGASAARETLASLPNTSAYGTNIIKFKKDNASAVPGEHIETDLTEEDIAVAAAKGWTVTLV